MRSSSSRSALLFAAAMVVCAFAMAPTASAASWGVVGTEHTLDSANFGFTYPAAGVTLSCSASTFTADVSSAAVLRITSATFRGCTSSGAVIGDCTSTITATNLPWEATPITDNPPEIQIHDVHFDLIEEDMPSGNTCNADGLKLTVTGTLTKALWTGNGAGQHSINLNGGPGLVSHSAAGNNSPVTSNGTLSDTQQTLTVN